MDVCLIQVPYMAGDERHGAADGPRCLLQAGAEELLTSKGIAVTVEGVERDGSFRDTASSTAAVNKHLAATVGKAVAAGQLPLVLAGSCVACMGVLAGFEHSRCGAVWIDAHADFNTPESTVSGFFPGMSTAVITGHCYQSYCIRAATLATFTPERDRDQKTLNAALRIIELVGEYASEERWTS